MDSLLCRLARHDYPAAQRNATEEICILEHKKNSMDEVRPSTRSSEFLEKTTVLHPEILPAASQRATTSVSPSPPKSLLNRFRIFAKECRARVAMFFAQKNFIHQFKKHFLVERPDQSGIDCNEAWKNLQEKFFLNASDIDVESFCNKLSNEVRYASAEQLGRMGQYISDLLRKAETSNNLVEREKIAKFFLNLSEALMFRGMDLFLDGLVNACYHFRGNETSLDQRIRAREISQVTPKIHFLQVQCLNFSCPYREKNTLLPEQKKSELRSYFKNRAKQDYDGVCSKPITGALSSAKYEALIVAIERQFENMISMDQGKTSPGTALASHKRI